MEHNMTYNLTISVKHFLEYLNGLPNNGYSGRLWRMSMDVKAVSEVYVNIDGEFLRMGEIYPEGMLVHIYEWNEPRTISLDDILYIKLSHDKVAQLRAQARQIEEAAISLEQFAKGKQ